MADDKKNTPEAAPPAEAPAPAAENAAVPEQSAPEPVLTNAEAVMLEHEGQAALFEMGEAVPDPADVVTHAEVEEPAAPEVPKAEKEQEQSPAPGKDAPPRHISARWWILPPPVTRRPRRRKRWSSRSHPRKRTRLPNPARGVRPRMQGRSR